ncbi:hypothetical protein RhiirA4_509410 [Rhizophagus irregularis]|uniref:Uncharacterized protein n=1 Tax=Rhizophagus irregularis TaxID=588596 RepID=A0A2I1HEF6_9GLOM|nr:hypothetical protein RhiirA4_509410 [Rhizophagus irregularis]
MTNVHTLNDINKGDSSFKGVGQRLGDAYEQEFKEKLYSALKSKAEINDLSEKLVDKYNEREKEFENKASQLIASSTFQSRRGATLAQKASSADKVQILSLETKIRELEGKLEDIDLERTYHDLDVTGGEPAQISSSEIESLRLELERAKEDHNSKEYTIECMEKGIEATHEITSREIDALYSARSNLMEENRSLRDQLELKENNEISPPPPPMNDSSQIISAGGAEMLGPVYMQTTIQYGSGYLPYHYDRVVVNIDSHPLRYLSSLPDPLLFCEITIYHLL